MSEQDSTPRASRQVDREVLPHIVQALEAECEELRNTLRDTRIRWSMDMKRWEEREAWWAQQVEDAKKEASKSDGEAQGEPQGPTQEASQEPQEGVTTTPSP